jgi:hypothetical protein
VQNHPDFDMLSDFNAMDRKLENSTKDPSRCANRLDRPRWRLTACTLAVIAQLTPLGCDRQPTVSGAPARPPLDFEIVLATPLDAARSVLTGLQVRRFALRRNDPAAAQRYLEQLRSTAARSIILKRYEEQARRQPDKPDVVLDRFVEGWGSIIGFYADRLQLDQLQAADQPANMDIAHAYLPIGSGADRTAIRLECVRESDGGWRVASIDFATLPVTSRPVTQPTR